MIKISFILVAILLMLQSCSKDSIGRYKLRHQKPSVSFSADNIPTKPDFTKDDSWLVKKDINETIDIFYVYPTAYYSPENWNQSIGDSSVIKRLNKFTFKKQLNIFDGIGNLYVPQYRQASLYSFIDKKSNGKQAINLAYQDIRNAFYYYLENYNNNKPFMLVGHSQGSRHILELLKEISLIPNINSKIVAVYALGWPVTDTYLAQNKNVKMCEDSTSTGCVVSWNTEGKHKLYSLVIEPSVSVNPLNWTTNNKFADKSLHKGAIFVSRNGTDTIYNCVSAQNKKGHLVISKPENIKNMWMPFKYGNYHVHDFSMFYFNIRENAIYRKRLYWKY